MPSADSPFRALRHRNFRLFWIGQCVSLMGTWAQTVALSWLVLDMTKSPLLLGLQTTIQYAPIVILSLPAGYLADRLPRRKTMILSQSFMAILAFILAAITFSGRISYPVIVLISALLGSANAFDLPLRHSLIGEIVSREDVTSAISMNSTITNLARVVGPVVASAAVATLGPSVAFLLNGLSFIAVIASLATMKVASEKPMVLRFEGLSRMWGEIREGLAYAGKTPAIALALTALFATDIFLFNYTVTVPVFASESLGLGPTGFGALMTSLGAGALGGALSASVLNRRGPQIRMIVVTAASLAGSYLGVSLAANLVQAVPFLATFGWSQMVFTNTVLSIIQLNVPDSLRGRVISVYSLILKGSPFFGGLYAGALCDGFGARAAFATSGLIGLSISAVLLVWSRRIRLNRT